MAHFASVCFSSILNPQVLLYEVHNSQIYYRELNILRRNNIQCFILKTGDYVHEQPNNNGPSISLHNVYGNERMNWMIDRGTLKFSTPHTNSLLVETWEAFKISSEKITQNAFKKTPPLSP